MTTLNPMPLKAFAWLITGFGLVLCLAGFSATLMPVDILYKIYHPGPEAPVWSQHLRFSTGLMGAVSFGWGLSLLAIAGQSPALGAQAKPLWAKLTTGLVIWFVVDSVISIANGFWVNAISNVVIGCVYIWAIRASGVRRL